MFTYGNYIDEVLMRNPVIYYVHDHLYSPVALVWSTGSVLERYEYDAYGEPNILDASYNKRSSSNYANPYYLTGRGFDFLDDGKLKLGDYRHRSYDHYAGRFLQNDPLGINPAGREYNRFDILTQYADGLNLYQYVKSNPVTNSDPMGLIIPNPEAYGQPPAFNLRSVCDSYSCKSCCAVGVMGYNDSAKEACYAEADQLSRKYTSFIQDYWESSRFSYTRCYEYQDMIIDDSGLSEGLEYFTLHRGGNATMGGFGEHYYVEVFHACNKKQIDAFARWATVYEPGDTADAIMDPWSPGFLTWWNSGYGNCEIQSGSSE